MIQTNSSTVLLSSGDLICNPSRYILYFQITKNIELSIVREKFNIYVYSNNEAAVMLTNILFDSDK
jgi:hypothetical protein